MRADTGVSIKGCDADDACEDDGRRTRSSRGVDSRRAGTPRFWAGAATGGLLSGVTCAGLLGCDCDFSKTAEIEDSETERCSGIA
jgi:hypothetical protein